MQAVASLNFKPAWNKAIQQATGVAVCRQWVLLENNLYVFNITRRIKMQSHYSTEVLAGHLQIKPQTVRAALCRDGHYFGLRPIKLPNRRLLWPADQVTALLSGNGKPSINQTK